jgi:putative ABC transport system permease protein
MNMLRNYFKTAWRNFFRNKAFSFINIAGLSLGTACSLLIVLWVYDEKNIDSFHAHDHDMYIIYERQHHDGVIDAGYYTPGLLPEELKHIYPEVKHSTGLAWVHHLTFEANNKILKELGNFGSPDFFKMFSYPLIQGTAENALKTSKDIAISRKMAITFFGSPEAAFGQSIRFQNKKDLNIAAVFEDIQGNSSFKFDFILNWETMLEENSWAREWCNNGPSTILVLHPGTDPVAFGKKIENFLTDYNKDQNKNFVIKLALQRYHDRYLHSNFKEGEIVGGRIQYVNLFSIIAVFIIVIACINFMNLTTARSVKRGKEIGIRKVAGAVRGALIFQFIGEALLVVCISFVLAVAMVWLVLPLFNTMTQKQISMPYGEPVFWLALTGLALVTGILAGSYPALYLSSFNPVKAFKGQLKVSGGAVLFRKGLVVFQFTLSILLIIGTIVVSRQVNYIQNVNLGYNRENLVYIPLEGDLAGKYDILKTRGLSLPGVKMISRCSNMPTVIDNGTGGVEWEGKDPNSVLQFTQAAIGLEFVSAMDITLLEGREFSKDFPSDTAAYIVNEKALDIFGYKNPIGAPLTFWQKKGTIVGVVKDFHFNSLHSDINPLVLRYGEHDGYGWALVRMDAGNTTKALAGLEKICKELNPQFPFNYRFADEEYAEMYVSEQIVDRLSTAFAGLGIFISCLGLLGLAMFTAEQRTKEIGIRKVLGASLLSLFNLLSREFFVLVTLALLIATPIAWFVMDDWLKEYAYRTELSWWIFALAGGFAIIIALITISFQTVKALLVNPTRSLRSE